MLYPIQSNLKQPNPILNLITQSIIETIRPQMQSGNDQESQLQTGSGMYRKQME